MEKHWYQQSQHFHKMICAVSSSFLLLFWYVLVYKRFMLWFLIFWWLYEIYSFGSSESCQGLWVAWPWIHSFSSHDRTKTFNRILLQIWKVTNYWKCQKKKKKLPVRNWPLFFSYSDSIGWSDKIQFRTPPAGGSAELRFLAFGDMGKAPLDPSAEHYIQVQKWLLLQ